MIRADRGGECGRWNGVVEWDLYVLSVGHFSPALHQSSSMNRITITITIIIIKIKNKLQQKKTNQNLKNYQSRSNKSTIILSYKL